MSDNEIIADLSPAGILAHICPEDLETLKFYGVFGEYGPGEVIVHQGANQKSLYYIVSGTLEVVISSSTNEVKLGEIGPGDCIGEVSVFEPGEASATVRVLETCVLWSLDVDALQSFFEQLPVASGQLMLGIAQLLTKRLRNANNAILHNRILPHHLSVRSGNAMEPIKADNLRHEKPGVLGGLFGKKPGPQKFKPRIKK